MARRRFLILLNIIVLLYIFSLNFPALAADYSVISKSGVNIRKGPGTHYEIIGTVPYGKIVSGDTTIQGWTRISNLSLDVQGFIKSDLLQPLAKNKAPFSHTHIPKEYGYIIIGLIFVAIFVLSRKLGHFIRKRRNKKPITPYGIEKKAIIQELAESIGIGLLLVFLIVKLGSAASTDTSTYHTTPSTYHERIAILCFFMIGVGFRSGWRYLSEQTSGLIISAPILGWLYLYIFKFALAVAIGAFLAPYFLLQKFRQLHELRKKERQQN